MLDDFPPGHRRERSLPRPRGRRSRHYLDVVVAGGRPGAGGQRSQRITEETSTSTTPILPIANVHDRLETDSRILDMTFEFYIVISNCFKIGSFQEERSNTKSGVAGINFADASFALPFRRNDQ